MKSLTRIVTYPINEEVPLLGKVKGKVNIYAVPDPNLKLTLCKLEFNASSNPIDYDAIGIHPSLKDKLELLLNCDSDELRCHTCIPIFVDNPAYRAYLTFAQDCLKKIAENEKHYEKKKGYIRTWLNTLFKTFKKH